MTAPVVHELPVAEVLRVRVRDGARLVRVRCPFCGKRHTHGWPPRHADPGARIAHCHRPTGEPARSYRVHVELAGDTP